jgi:hypothetical protein
MAFDDTSNLEYYYINDDKLEVQDGDEIFVGSCLISSENYNQ